MYAYVSVIILWQLISNVHCDGRCMQEAGLSVSDKSWTPSMVWSAGR